MAFVGVEGRVVFVRPNQPKHSDARNLDSSVLKSPKSFHFWSFLSVIGANANLVNADRNNLIHQRGQKVLKYFDIPFMSMGTLRSKKIVYSTGRRLRTTQSSTKCLFDWKGELASRHSCFALSILIATQNVLRRIFLAENKQFLVIFKRRRRRRRLKKFKDDPDQEEEGNELFNSFNNQI